MSPFEEPQLTETDALRFLHALVTWRTCLSIDFADLTTQRMHPIGYTDDDIPNVVFREPLEDAGGYPYCLSLEELIQGLREGSVRIVGL